MAKKEELSIVSKYLSNISSLRAFAKDKEIAFLEKALENLSQVIVDQKEMIELERIELEELEINRQAIIKELAEKGWTLEALLNPVMKENKKRSSGISKPKYAYPAETGEMLYWSGRGRMPFGLKELINNGRNLEDFLISN